MIPSESEIIKASGFHPSRVFNIYIFGSQVYKTSNSDSDWDIIMVCNNSVDSIELSELRDNKFNIHVYTPKKFQEDINWHRINNLECLFAPDWAKIKETIKFEFKLDYRKLRHSISHISSNSWVKSKKKIDQGDYYIGIKSLFHSIRIPMFGVQISEFGKIVDFSESNYIWDEIYNSVDRLSFEDLDKNWRPLRNKTLTKFREKSTKI